MESRSLSLTEETWDLLDAAEEQARRHPDLPNKTQWRSEIARQIFDAGIDALDAEDASVMELLPEDALLNYQIAAEKETQKSKNRVEYLRSGWRDYVRGELQKLMNGDDPAEPMRAAKIMDGHRAEMKVMFDAEPDRLEANENWLDERLEAYRWGYAARTDADQFDAEINTGDADNWFSVGEDLWDLHRNADQVVNDMTRIADSSAGWDQDAVLDGIAKNWNVSRGAARVIVAALSGADTIQKSLALGELAEEPQLPSAPEQDLSEISRKNVRNTHAESSNSGDPRDKTPPGNFSEEAQTGGTGPETPENDGVEVDEQTAEWLAGDD